MTVKSTSRKPKTGTLIDKINMNVLVTYNRCHKHAVKENNKAYRDKSQTNTIFYKFSCKVFAMRI